MSFNLSNVKWGRVIVGIILAFVIAFAVPFLVNVGYGVVLGFQLRGNPPMEQINAFARSLPAQIVGYLAMALGALIGGRFAARGAEDGYQLNGLVVGVGLAMVWLVVGLVTGGVDLWSLIYYALAIVGGWFGGWLVSRRPPTEEA